MRLDFTGIFGVCKSFISGVLLYPLVEYMQCQQENPTLWEAIMYFLGIEERVYKCRYEKIVLKSLVLLIVIEILWIIFILLNTRTPLRKIKFEPTRCNKEEEMAIDALVFDAVIKAQQSLSS
ncbi:uncharacterized protein LOC111123626 [Crassostrea virginica]